MARIEASVVIDRPVEEAFAFASNPENNMEWQSAVSEVKKTSEGPIGVGTTYRGADRFLGHRFLRQRIDWTLEVIGYDLNRKVEFKIDGGPLQLEKTVTYQPVDGGTRVTAVYEGDPGGFFKLALAVLVRMFQGQIQGDLDNLKSVLEARGEAAG